MLIPASRHGRLSPASNARVVLYLFPNPVRIWEGFRREGLLFVIKISARINTFNEEDNIAAALESLSWADELIVVDSFSTDRTVEIARRYTDKVVQHEFRSHGEQHNWADALCSHEWIFVLDADERVTPELRASILAFKEKGADLDGFRMARRAWYIDRWIRHSGWYPNWQTRLYRRSRGKWAGEPPHEAPKVDGHVGTLQGDLLHFTRRSLHEHVEVMNHYTDLASAARFRQGKKVGLLMMLVSPPWTFLRSYILKQGFRDGWTGLVIAGLAASYVHLKQAKLMEKYRATEPSGKTLLEPGNGQPR